MDQDCAGRWTKIARSFSGSRVHKLDFFLLFLFYFKVYENVTYLLYVHFRGFVYRDFIKKNGFGS